MRTFLSGADVVLPDRLASGHTVVIEGDRIVDLVAGPRQVGEQEQRLDLTGTIVLPGFIDVHVHGVAGVDVLDGPGAIEKVARELPRWGVTAFCPTTVACAPEALDGVLAEVALLRAARPSGAARVLPAHLESNFINPEFCGAQPRDCLRVPASPGRANRDANVPFDAADLLATIDRRRADIGIVTLAPEIAGGLDLVRQLSASGIRVSLGHTGADFDIAQAAMAAGARQATHLFNRMTPFTHRDPGVAGAVLASDDIAAELICDGWHVHPAALRLAIAAKSAARILAISDGTAGSGLPAGATAALGGRPIVVGDVARLQDGTIAGSVATMATAFQTLVNRCGIDLVRAATMCATTPARELGLIGFGVIAPGATADLTVLDRRLNVIETWIAGERIADAA